jgi:hypothetical protein
MVMIFGQPTLVGVQSHLVGRPGELNWCVLYGHIDNRHRIFIATMYLIHVFRC